MNHELQQSIAQFKRVYYFKHIPTKAEQKKKISKLRKKLKPFGKIPTRRSFKRLMNQNPGIVVLASQAKIHGDSYYLVLFNKHLLENNDFNKGWTDFIEEERNSIGRHKYEELPPPPCKKFKGHCKKLYIGILRFIPNLVFIMLISLLVISIFKSRSEPENPFWLIITIALAASNIGYGIDFLKIRTYLKSWITNYIDKIEKKSGNQKK